MKVQYSRLGFRCALIASACALLASPASAQRAADVPAASDHAKAPLDVARIEAVADAEGQWIIKRGSAPGVCIAVGHAGKLIFVKGYGQADIENNVPVTPDSAFRIASVTKQYTAALIMKLVESGKVKLDEAVSTYLPDTPEQFKNVTIRQLLSHTGGVPDFIDQRTRVADLVSKVDVSYADIMKVVADSPLDFEPGAKYAYSNTGYHMLGEVIARTSGVTYREFLARELLVPLGLTRTGYTSTQEIILRRVRGYFDDKDGFVNARYLSPDVAGPSGAIYATAGDLVRWTQLLHAGKAVSSESLKEMTTAAKLNDGSAAEYGLGTQVMTRLNRPAFSHGGNGSGFSAFACYWPDADLTVVVLANGREVLPNLAGEAVARAALGLDKEAITLAPDALKQYEGTYEVTMAGRTAEIRVYADGPNLIGHRKGNRPFRFVPKGEHRFIHEQDSKTEFSFAIADGKATGVVLKNPRGEFNGVRKP